MWLEIENQKIVSGLCDSDKLTSARTTEFFSSPQLIYINNDPEDIKE
jgi:hypothetical protein